MLLIGLLFGVVALLSWGFQDYLNIHAARKIGVFKTVVWFQIVVLVILLAMAPFFYGSPDLTPFALLLVLLTAIAYIPGFLFFGEGLKLGNASIVTTIAAGWGAITAVLGALFLSELLGGFQVLCICVIVVGTILAALNLNIKEGKKAAAKRWTIYAVAAAVSWGIYFFLISLDVSIIGWFPSAFLLTILTVIMMLGYAAMARKPIMFDFKRNLSLLWMGVVGALGLVAFGLGVSFDYADIIAPIGAASPMITVILVYLFMKDRLSLNQIVGIALILAGIVALSL